MGSSRLFYVLLPGIAITSLKGQGEIGDQRGPDEKDVTLHSSEVAQSSLNKRRFTESWEEAPPQPYSLSASSITDEVYAAAGGGGGGSSQPSQSDDGAFNIWGRGREEPEATTLRGSERDQSTDSLFYVSMQDHGQGARNEIIEGKRETHPEDREPTKILAGALEKQKVFDDLEGDTRQCIREMKWLLVRNKLRDETPKEYAFFASWLAHAEQLEELDLSFTPYLSTAFNYMAEMIEIAVKEDPSLKPLQKLRAIYLNGVPLAPRADRKRERTSVCDGLIRFLSLCPNIKAVHLARTKLGVEGAEKLNDWLSTTMRLEHIDLREGHIGDEGMVALRDGLLRQQKLQYLNVIDNKITAKGADIIAYLIPQFLDLKYLYLGENKIGNEGIKFIVEGLEKLVTNIIEANNSKAGGGQEAKTTDYASCLLDKIDFSKNDIGKEGFNALFTWLNSLGAREELRLQLRRLNIEENTAGFDEATYYEDKRDGTRKKYKAYTLFDGLKITAESGEVRELLPQPFTHLRELGLSFSPRTSSEGEKVVSRFVDRLRYFHQLEWLHLAATPKEYADLLEGTARKTDGSEGFKLKITYLDK